MSYIDLRQHSPESFAEIILKKLNKAQNFTGEEVVFKATAKMSIGLLFAPNQNRIPTLGIEIINKTKEPRFFKEPFFQLSKPYNNTTHFGLINRDLIGIFPFKLEYGEARLLHYYLDDIHGIIPKMFSEIEDDVNLTAVVSTTIDEKVKSNKVLAEEIKEQFKFFRDTE